MTPTGRARCWTRTALAVAWLACGVALQSSPGAARAEPEVATPVVHYLPFPAGVTHAIFQGNDQGPSHNDQWNRHAFDFSPLPESAPVCATADGIVTYVKEDTAGPTGNTKDNNEVAIRHADGTVGTYLHLEKDGALVEVGDVVYAGDVIGRAGNTGKSTNRHLHFGLRSQRRGGPSVPCRFADVPGDGVPKTGDRVTSGNLGGRRLEEVVAAIESLYDDASAMDAREAVTSGWKSLAKRPPRAVTLALEALGNRKDFVAAWGQRRDALLARHQGEGQALHERVAASSEAGALEDAVYGATVGKREFADLEVGRAFGAALKALRKQEKFSDAEKALRPRFALRDAVVRALERDLENRAKASRGKRVRWKSALFLYDKALEAAQALSAAPFVERLTRRRGALETLASAEK